MFDIFIRITVNYLVVQACIGLFFLPFYLLYRRNYYKNISLKASFNYHLENFFSSRYANWLVLCWAAGEAVIWFVIPEFLLLLLVFMRIRRKRQLLYYDIYGTALGTLRAYLIHLPAGSIDKLPYIQPGMVAQVQSWYHNMGMMALIHQPFSGVPYKVFTHLAPQYHLFLPVFLIFAVIVRISRYYIVYVILTSIYPVLHKYVYKHYVRLAVAGTFIFSLLLLKVYIVYGPGYQVASDLVHIFAFSRP
jgi:membrane protein YqaA with SNARE-associated domain